MLTALDKAPFPWFGGKRHAAPHVWAALGDVDHYAEPFAGSLANLLCRPHEPNRAYHSETVNDLDGFVTNFWRALAADPDGVADAASWPVSEADMHARHVALVRWMRDPDVIARLSGTHDWCDVRMAGWWVWGQSSWIGAGWCSGRGPWTVDERGCLVRQGRGVWRQLGVNHAGAREAGVARQLPHLGNDGRGVNRPQAREAGVARKRPHISNDGVGVLHAGAREAGVARQRPHISDNGVGVLHAGAREAGVSDDAEEREWHPMTMPELRRWLRFLAARLRHVRILCGSWERLATTGALQTIGVRQGGHAGVFLDPPYAHDVRDDALYTHDTDDVSHAVREWCRANGDNPRYRIVLAGFDGEAHAELEALGWTAVEWYRAGHLRGGMANQGADGTKQHCERLWLSPHCIRPRVEVERQVSLFAGAP